MLEDIKMLIWLDPNTSPKIGKKDHNPVEVTLKYSLNRSKMGQIKAGTPRNSLKYAKKGPSRA